jgi:leader peptidase (prepilin peptidase)/N-methyltransferase
LIRFVVAVSALAGLLLATPSPALAAASSGDALPLTPVTWVWIAFVGLCVGSFLNVVIHRLPIMMRRQERDWIDEALTEAGEAPPSRETEDGPYNLVVPRSACPACGHRISALENVPVASWLALRGRCRGCGSRISARYPLIELLTGVATIVVVLQFGAGWTGLWVAVFTWALIAASAIDLDHQLLPDVIVLPMLWLGLLVNLDGTFAALDDAVIGAVAGYLSLWSVYHVFRLVTGKEGMGYGDFKLLAAMGAWMGWAALPAVVLLSSLTGIAGALLAMATGRMARGQPMPFGPFIASAGWIALFLQATDTAFPGF